LPAPPPPHHTPLALSPGSTPVYTTADATLLPFLSPHNPGWIPFKDKVPVRAEATRRKVYDMLVGEKMLLQGFHYPFPSLAYVEKNGSGYREIPVPWNPTI